MKHKTPLSRTEAGREWSGQFGSTDQSAAAAMLDAMLLLDTEQVARAQLAGLEELAGERHGRRGMPRRRIALYAEREIAEAAVFVTKELADARGKPRRRAVGPQRLAPVKPRRGSARVGSEGPTAFVIAQAVEKWRQIYIGHPGPEIIRKRRAGMIVLVTDFIGSGTRIQGMLDKFWRVPSVRAWWSLGWIEFGVVAAAATAAGLHAVRCHRTKPRVLVRHIAPTINSAEPALTQRWQQLIQNYGPAAGRGALDHGFGDNAALIAFSYRIPNNTPAIVHASGGGWQALYVGPAPRAAEAAFAPLTPEERVTNAVEEAGVTLPKGTPVDDARVLLLLRAIRGRWRDGANVEIAERTGLTEPEVREAKRRAEDQGLLDAAGRLTDDGHTAMDAATAERKRPDIPTEREPYYPWSLRVPRATSSKRRLARRP